ncbi:cupin domain-containing protein [Kutzneria sp. NPDC052558]|uniref:AraC family transcriptional regulator n=1 Tax=Kutzneria sp. NPDC052558 TaxID=3364121 RepID=UPI0037CAFABB
MDLLGDLLAVGGVRGALGARIEAGGNWRLAWHKMRGAAFYAVTSGTAWLCRRDEEPVQLMPGDVVLLPSGTPHALVSSPEQVLVPHQGCDTSQLTDGSLLRLGDGEVRTHVVGACYEYDPSVTTQVMNALPPVLHIRADNAGTGLDDTVRLLARELASPQAASSYVLNRVVDILLVQALRAWLAGKPNEVRGTCLSALTDPVVSAALAQLHQEPARPWTTDSLAAELTISRSTLTRRFRAVIGSAPADYLTRWRMDLAATRLRDTDDTLDSIARSVGYTSVYAFSRAFRRARAQAPGQFRATIRTP